MLQKLTALIPAPHAHLVRYAGLFAPAAKWRSLILPTAEKFSTASACLAALPQFHRLCPNPWFVRMHCEVWLREEKCYAQSVLAPDRCFLESTALRCLARLNPPRPASWIRRPPKSSLESAAATPGLVYIIGHTVTLRPLRADLKFLDSVLMGSGNRHPTKKPGDILLILVVRVAGPRSILTKIAAWPAKAGCNCAAHYRLCYASVICATGPRRWDKMMRK